MKVLAALSGGVDSSVAAAMLIDEGHEVVGATLKLWGGASDTGCCSVADVEDARRSATQLGIDHHVFNYTDAFDRHVVEPYVADHVAGRTPNPCIECNRHLKFDALLRRAEVLGFDAVATGHHARRIQMADGSWRIGRGQDPAKDQSYVLYTVTSADLDGVLFPIGDMTKPEVRSVAAERGLRTAGKPESQDVCFITRSEGREAFLAERVELHPARVVDRGGVEVGSTGAVETVTVGQRKGLNLAGGAGRRFVTSVDVRGRTVTVGEAADLLVDSSQVGSVVWPTGVPEAASLPGGLEVSVQCSAHGEAVPATLHLSSGGDVGCGDVGAGGARGGDLVVEWHSPQPKVAPGQAMVFYRPVGPKRDRAGAAAGLAANADADQIVVGGGTSLAN